MLAGAIVSAAVGLLFLETVSEAHERHKSVVRWLQRIAELNHHIRKALRIITFNNVAERSTEAIKRVDSAVTRVESTLREASPSPGSSRFVK
jgi:gas vesicle protein